ncbi:MAG TPA: phosphoglycerate kinase [Nitrospira sp.]|jgi:phosphoglycerate kinase|uniref:phosphoglycerate kinase n=1 Tax=Nitrospira sp. ND1 TaxID=1658518 RepID=UPI0009BB632F|nr:phosphoglycerate kinase [Nitrospira sp. ND1]HAN90953.1 phosphoglycerate kinase [Nitrospira sp.]SLM43447.1 phosphoglycerate kinase [Nitrospira sp. ND1]HNP81415.1 phosphoglycerate kinase [Nitrospira sp.]HNV32312.1 phosphoglycerate kinase [Nitrospira sp.]HPW15218.1 phosphoglycerate kinase [Nitrospira sp.]
MNIRKRIIEDVQLRGKRVIIRADYNVPLDDSLQITDDTRIRSTLPTINRAVDEGAKVILCSHLGRPKGRFDPKFSLAPVAKRLQRLLGKEVIFAPDCIGAAVEGLVAKMQPGDVMLLENLRFHPEEEKNDDGFSKALASLADVYINDAFGAAHRAHASTVGITKYIPEAAAGYLLKKEIEYLEGAVENPVRPFVAILGGAKVSGKIGVIENLGKKVDKVIIGGGMAFTFLKAMGLEIGQSLVENDMLDFAKGVQDHAFSSGVKFYLPVDCVVAASREPGAETKIVPVQEIPKGWYGLDIGPASVKLFSEAVQDAKTILWNGPMGMFEVDAFARGTLAMAHSVANAYALTIVGGGETALAIHRAGESESISFISTGGGAALELLEGKTLPGLAALPNRAA